MPQLNKELSYEDILERINDGIRSQASRPNIYAYRPHHKQYDFHKSDRHITLYIGGNRSGKTVGGAVECIYRLTGRHPYKSVPPPPIRGRAVAVDFDYGVDVLMLPMIAQWLPPSFLINGSWSDSYNNQHRTLHLANKSTLEFRSYVQDLEKFAGTSRHFTWFDEEPPKGVWDECLARLIDVQGDAFITMTPVEGMSWIYEDIYLPGTEGNDKDVKVIEIEMLENPYITPEAAERFLKRLAPEDRKARERGEFVAVGGKVFKNFSIQTHVINATVPPKEWAWYVSFDFGFNSPTAILWHAVSPGNEVITFSEHYRDQWTVSQHAEVFHERNKGFGKEPDFVVGDPAMMQKSGIQGTSYSTEYAKHGIYIAKGGVDADSAYNRMIQYVNGFEGNPSWKITESCPSLISEMRKLRWATYASKKMRFDLNKKEKVHKKDDHACDSCRYFFSFMPDLTPVEIYEKSQTYSELLRSGVAMNSWDALANPLGEGPPVVSRLDPQPKTKWETYEYSALYEEEA